MRHLSIMSLLVFAFVLLVSPVHAAGWTAEITRLDLTAGPGNSAAYLAPDGSRIAHFKNDELCLYTLDGEQESCTELQRDVNIELESVRWSPDSTKLAFSEDFIISFRDSDIWLFDTETTTFTDLTPAPNREADFFSNDDPDAVFTVDMIPQWSADSQLVYFIRYQFQKPKEAIATFYRVSVNGGEPEVVTPVDTKSPVSTYGFAVSPDDSRIAYNIDTRGKEQDGTWFLDVASGDMKFAAAVVQDTLPWAYQFSPSGDLVLSVGTSNKMSRFGKITPEDSAVYTLPVFGGRQQSLDSEHFVFSAGWGTEGSTLAYTTFGNQGEDVGQGLYITPAPGEKGELVLAGRFMAPTPTSRAPLMWAANNTLLLTDMEDFKVVVVRLTAG